MTRQQFLGHINLLFEQCLDIVHSKNHDYANSDDPFANFALCEEMGLCKTEIGILMRITDKFKRITTYLNKGELKVENESVDDAIMDIINYMAILHAYLNRYREHGRFNTITTKDLPTINFDSDEIPLSKHLEPGCNYTVLGIDRDRAYIKCRNDNTKELCWFQETNLSIYGF